jgi:glycine betaine/choline ABC-type transport system substrate-binding protein
MNRLRPLILLLSWLLFITGTALPSKATPPPSSRKIIVAAKPFTESYILSEMLAQIIDAEGEATAVRKFGLGGPTLVVDGLKAGELDLDVSYTGALSHLFLPQTPNPSRAELLTALRSHGLLLSESLGFNNTYAIAVRTAMAQTLRLANISDLIPHHTLRGAFTPDFLNYDDGFYKLQQVYGVALQSIKPMQHSLAYQALQSREIDLTDAYTTDGALPQFELTLLKDDRGFFPTYFAVILIRAEIAERFPKTWQALRKLEGQLSEAQMTAVNAQVDVHKREVSAVAREFLVQHKLIGNPRPPTRGAVLDEGLWIATAEHLYLVLSALLLSCLLGVPLGVVAVQFRRTGQGPDCGDQSPSDDSFAGSALLSHSHHGNWGDAHHLCAVSVRTPSSRAEYDRWAVVSGQQTHRDSQDLGPYAASATAPDRAADGLPIHPVRNQDHRCHQRGHSDDRRADRSRRLRPLHYLWSGHERCPRDPQRSDSHRADGNSFSRSV